MPDLELHPVLAELARVIGEETEKRTYACTVPAEVVPTPYLVLWPIGGTWDQGFLEQGVQSVFYGLQVDGVGRSEQDCAWALDKARQVLLHHRPVAGDGWSLGGAVSDGPPLPSEGERLVRSSSERYTLHITAS